MLQVSDESHERSLSDHSGTYTVPMTGAIVPQSADRHRGGPAWRVTTRTCRCAILPYIKAEPKPGSEAVPML